MQHFDVLTEHGLRIHALGTTRAGLFTACVKGLFSASTPRFQQNAERTERSFSLEAENDVSLLERLLQEALSSSRAKQEAYEDVVFSLITDKKAEGTFVGRAVIDCAKDIKGVQPGLEVKKNAIGNWEATVGLIEG